MFLNSKNHIWNSFKCIQSVRVFFLNVLPWKMSKTNKYTRSFAIFFKACFGHVFYFLLFFFLICGRMSIKIYFQISAHLHQFPHPPINLKWIQTSSLIDIYRYYLLLNHMFTNKLSSNKQLFENNYSTLIQDNSFTDQISNSDHFFWGSFQNWKHTNRNNFKQTFDWHISHLQQLIYDYLGDASRKIITIISI